MRGIYPYIDDGLSKGRVPSVDGTTEQMNFGKTGDADVKQVRENSR